MTKTVTIDGKWLKHEFKRAVRRSLLVFSLPYAVIWYLITFRPQRAWEQIKTVWKAAIED